MSASPIPADLMNGAECINRCIPDGMKMAVLISIFAKLANMNTDPKTLMDGATCIDRCIPDGMKMAVLIYAATQITTGGSSGVTMTPVNTGIVDLGDSWTNNTGKPVIATAVVNLNVADDSTTVVLATIDGVQVAVAAFFTPTVTSNPTMGSYQNLVAVVLPGKTLSIVNDTPGAGNSLAYLLAFSLS